jgi:hypothetical protein
MTVKLSHDVARFNEIGMQQRFSATEDDCTFWQWEIGLKEIFADGSEHIQGHHSVALIQITVLAVQLAEVYNVQVKEVCWHDAY